EMAAGNVPRTGGLSTPDPSPGGAAGGSSGAQSVAQEPGPRGSPHVPQPGPSAGSSPAAPSDRAARPPELPTANVERSFSRAAPPQAGQAATAFPITRVSNRREQRRQRYSNR